MTGRVCKNKIRYPTLHAAQIGLVSCVMRRNRGRKDRKEWRTYVCPTCHGWHLTSKKTWKETT